MTGGILLLLSAAVSVAARAPLAGIAPAKDWLYAAAAIVLVVGLDRAGSITRRRIVGTVATILLVALPLTQAYWFSFVPDSRDDPHLAEDVSVYIAVAYYGAIAVLAVVSVVEIARAKVIPSPWRWAPLWVMVCTPIVFGIGLALFSAAPIGSALASAGAIIAGYGPAVGTAFLGTLGVVLGARRAPRKSTTDSAAALAPLP